MGLTFGNYADLQIIGRYSQLFPSYLRIVCRSRIDYTPAEILDKLRDSGMENLKTWERFGVYRFAAIHYEAFRTYTPDAALLLISGIRSNDYLVQCPYIRSEKKTSCFMCGMVREFMGVIDSGEKTCSGSSPTCETGVSPEKSTIVQNKKTRYWKKRNASEVV